MQTDIPYLGRVEVDEYVEKCVSVHSLYTPFWKEYEKRHNFDLKKIDSLGKLLEELPIFPSSIIKKIDPLDLVPSLYKKENLLESVSSGTTGEPKTVYWGEDEVRLMIDFAAYCLKLQDFPTGEKWIGTETPNKVLKRYLRGLARKMVGDFEGVEVNEDVVNAVKKAAETGDIRGMIKAYSPIIERVTSSIRHGARVYEDATLGLLLGGQALQQFELNKDVKGVLFGGVATSTQNVIRLKEIFPNSKIGGWYGNHFSGVVMYRPTNDFSTLYYQPPFPLVSITVRKKPDLKDIVDYGERGVVVATKVSEYSLLSLELGDEATRSKPLQPFSWDSIRDVTRLKKEEMKEIEERLYSRFL